MDENRISKLARYKHNILKAMNIKIKSSVKCVIWWPIHCVRHKHLSVSLIFHARLFCQAHRWIFCCCCFCVVLRFAFLQYLNVKCEGKNGSLSHLLYERGLLILWIPWMSHLLNTKLSLTVLDSVGYIGSVYVKKTLMNNAKIYE